ncbi:MAG: hypothetical protein IPK21_15435, partial [Haliscomenobacter sp.]|nr:hypothetical protein [Haliscomenobacter sp.]
NYSVALYTKIDSIDIKIEQPLDTVLLPGARILLTSISPEQLTYQWLLDGEIIPDSIHPKLLADRAGAYQVFVRNAEGCENRSNVIRIRLQEQITPCACASQLTLTLNPNTCSTRLTLDQAGFGGCSSSYKIIVADTDPSNGDIIDCPGEWTYGIFAQDGGLVCSGKVIAEDKSGPLLTGVDGGCDLPGKRQRAVLPAPPNALDPTALVWRDTFLCTDLNGIFNVDASWKDAAYRYY